MLEIGLFDEAPQQRTGVSPRAVLLEALEEHLPSRGDDVVLVRVWGRRGDAVTGHQVVDDGDERFSALARTTAFPTTALAHLVLEGRVDAGAATMGDAVAAEDLVAELGEVGIEVADFAP